MNGSCILLPSLQRQYFREAHTFPEYGIYQQLIEKSCKHTINNRRKTEPCKHFTEINSVYICVCMQTGMLKIDIDATCCKSAYYVSQYLTYYTSRHFYLPLCLNSHPPPFNWKFWKIPSQKHETGQKGHGAAACRFVKSFAFPFDKFYLSEVFVTETKRQLSSAGSSTKWSLECTDCQ